MLRRIEEMTEVQKAVFEVTDKLFKKNSITLIEAVEILKEYEIVVDTDEINNEVDTIKKDIKKMELYYYGGCIYNNPDPVVSRHIYKDKDGKLYAKYFGNVVEVIEKSYGSCYVLA